MCVAQGWILRDTLGGIEGARLLSATIRVLIAAALMGAAAYGVWYGLDEVMGHSLAAQLVEVLVALAVGVAVYAAAVWALRVPEAHQIRELLVSRGRSRG
jgi:hypothetical protein